MGERIEDNYAKNLIFLRLHPQKQFVQQNFALLLKLAYICKLSLAVNSASSYRAVSNLTFLSKIIKRLFCLRLTSYLHEHRLLSLLQSAYRHYHPTETATQKVASDIFDTADSGKMILLSLLDLSATFDIVDYNILVTRMVSVARR